MLVRVFAAVDRHQNNFGDNLMRPLLRNLFARDPILSRQTMQN
jgi:hypothetical protein